MENNISLVINTFLFTCLLFFTYFAVADRVANGGTLGEQLFCVINVLLKDLKGNGKALTFQKNVFAIQNI